jgi:hypothetical protein
MLMVSDVRVSRLLVQYMGKAIMDIGVWEGWHIAEVKYAALFGVGGAALNAFM